MTRRELDNLFSPFDHKGVDRTLIVIMLACLFGSLAYMRYINVYPAPPSIATKVLIYVLESDGTVCYSQNTKQNRDQKHDNETWRN